MNEQERKTLETLGWPAELLDALNKRVPQHDAVDQMFLNHAERALSEVGCSALGWLASNPGVSVTELAKRLNRGASALGLIMSAYHQATKDGTVREVAKDLFIRQLISAFPDGWSTAGDVHPLVRIGRWDSDVTHYACGGIYEQNAERIIRSLAIDNPPQEGWKPNYPNDPLIDELFNAYWPVE